MGDVRRSDPVRDPRDVIAVFMRSNADASEMGLPSGVPEDVRNEELREETRLKPIVSINGRDVDEGELNRGIA
jgi:hypothetical protein